MTRSRSEYDDEEDDFEDEADEYGDDSDVDLLPCPHCGAAIYEEAQRCPMCGEYVDAGASHAGRKPIWIVATLVLLVVMFVFFALNGW
ncbi:MAG: zinc ribbon domain-containing protein [Pirellulales bacterium]